MRRSRRRRSTPPDIADRIQWSTGFCSKWIVHDELDAGGLAKDLTSLQARTELIPFLQGVFYLYQYEAKAQQTYVAGLSAESRLSGAWRLTGR